MTRFKGERVLAVVGATALLLLGFDSVTYAATGSSLLLGKVNKAGTTTTIQNTGTGPALKLTTASTASAPFSTNAKGKVVNLFADKAATATTAGNASKLGGKTLAQVVASAAPTVLTFRDTADSQTNLNFYNANVPAGTYLLTFSANLKLAAPVSGSPYIVCASYNGQQSLGEGAWQVDAPGWYAAPSYSNVITLDRDSTLLLYCQSTTSAGWTIPTDGQGPTWSFLKIGAQSTTSITSFQP